MTLGDLRKITEGMDDSTEIVIMNTYDGEVSEVEDVSVNRDMPVVYIEAAI